MRSIFEPLRSSWESLMGSVHVYALPEWDAPVVQPWQDAIARSGVCALQPVPNLHATIARTPLFLPTDPAAPGPAELEQFAAALTGIAASRSSFAVSLRRPEVMATAVCATGEPTADWDSLISQVRAAIGVCFPGRPTPPGPYAPHVSLGYGQRDTDDAPLTAAFDALAGTPWSGSLAVTALHLLSVDANAEAGSFTWRTLSVHPLL